MLNEVLKSEIINTTRAENNVSTSLNNLLTSLTSNVHLTLTDLLKVLRVLNEDLNSHLKTIPVEVKVDEGNLGIIDVVWHALS